MPKRVAVMLDGGHLRIYANRANRAFDPAYIYIEKLPTLASSRTREDLT